MFTTCISSILLAFLTYHAISGQLLVILLRLVALLVFTVKSLLPAPGHSATSAFYRAIVFKTTSVRTADQFYCLFMSR